MIPESEKIKSRTRRAVRHFWDARNRQITDQSTRGRRDAGSRGAVTGGKQMDGFIDLFAWALSESGVQDASVYRQKSLLVLPGFYRPTKQWDILVVADGLLVAAIEAKSQVGSFGNNFNNRTEEAIGSAVDLWKAFRAGPFQAAPPPFVGWMMLLEDSEASRRPTKPTEPHFPVLPEFREASYAKRYELLCERLVRETHYTATGLVLAERRHGAKGQYTSPSREVSMEQFVRTLAAHATAFAGRSDHH